MIKSSVCTPPSHAVIQTATFPLSPHPAEVHPTRRRAFAPDAGANATRPFAKETEGRILEDLAR